MPNGSASPSAAAEETIFNGALDLPAIERSAYLDAACQDNQPLRRRVEALLCAHDAPPGFLPQNPVTTPVQKEGDFIGPYKLLEKLGEGGFGVVYVAEQREPVRRRVALKIVKLGMDTRQVVARFEAERQALALMDHPNIAKVLDAGAMESGRPYFVMELVRGVKITEFCDKAKLPTRQRLELFAQVCQAVQHAHQKGIIHRDLKPSNILVTLHDGVPVPKVIDFGIAKATQGQLTDKTIYTRFEHFIGTPAYMSPEQAEMSGLDVDTRSDIYSLGVLLYELLTGRTPFDQDQLLHRGLDEMRRMIREQEAPRPSTILSTMTEADITTAAAARQLEPPKLIHAIRDDLDWIVMRCLEKERARRYESASGLAMDIQRHLAGEPVLACPPSAAYRFRKLAHRNKGIFAAISAVAAALILGTIVSTWQAFRATEAEQNAEQEEAKAKQSERLARIEAAKNQLTGDVLGNTFLVLAQGLYRSGSGPALNYLLDRAEGQLENDSKLNPGIFRPGGLWFQGHEALDHPRLADEPEAQAYVFSHLSRIYLQIAEYKKAEAMQQKALALWKKAPGNHGPEIADSLLTLAEIFLRRNDLPGAETNYQEALKQDPKVWERNANHLGLRGSILAQHSHWKDAAIYISQGVEMEPEEQWGWYILAPVLIQSGDISQYKTNCSIMLQRFAKTTDPAIANRTAMACLLLPSALTADDFAIAVKLADFAATQPNHWRLMTKALAEYRQGHLTQAIALTDREQKEYPLTSPSASQAPSAADTQFIAAMSESRLNHLQAARAALARGVQIVQSGFPPQEDLGAEWWHDKVMSYILMREAQATVEAGAAAKK